MPRAGGSKKPGDLGRAIQRRAVQDRRKKRNEGTGFHVADLAESNNPLQSVTEASSLEEFMAAASMADRSFTAEKANIRFVADEPAMPPVGNRKSGYFGPISAPSLRDVDSGTVLDMRIPRRPAWDGSTTAEQLHRAEKDAFLEWRRQLAVTEVEQGTGGLAAAAAANPDGTVASSAPRGEVTPFEKNLEVWRQLWRVVERSDVLVQIVDARNPLMFRCPDLEEYVREVNPDKRTLLVLNKADYLTPQQRMSWARYFTAQGLDYVFFSAKREAQRLEAQDKVQRAQGERGQPLPALHEDRDEKDYEDSVDGGSGEGEGSSLGGPGEGAQAQGASAAAALDVAAGKSGKSVASIAAARETRRATARDRALLQAIRSKAVRSTLVMDSDSEGEGQQVQEQEEEEEEDEQEEEEEEEEEKEESVPLVPPPPTGSELEAQVEALMTIRDDGNAGLDTADPLYGACTVLTRDALLEWLGEKYKDIARGELGSSDEAGRARRAAWLAKKKEEARAARKAELEKRREQIQRMIEVGLGAHVRFGDAADAHAVDAEDEAAHGDAEGGGGEEGEGFTGLGEGEDNKPPLIVGMVGYPNVGKSSTINALLGATAGNHLAKRVAVASTPGKTKHFQTLPLNDDITLCDCPGLVFPSFVITREEMVVNGVLPIDNMRDHVPPVRLLCQRIPRSTLEAFYGVRLPTPGAGQPANRQPTPQELLDAFCKMRGFAASVHGGWDHPRGARLLLKDYCEGRLVYAHPPPGGWTAWYGASTTGAGGHSVALSTTDIQQQGGAGRGAGKVGFSDNVLLPSVQKRHTAPPGPTGTSAPVPVPAVQAVQPQVEREDSEEEEEEGSDGDEAAGADSEDSLDEETLLSFAKVVVVKKVARPGPKGEEEEEGEEEEGEEEGEEDVPVQATVYTGAAIKELESSGTLPATSSHSQSGRAARERGLGRHGKKRKGERAADPYGTEATAEAANRRYWAAEIAAVTSGPASSPDMGGGGYVNTLVTGAQEGVGVDTPGGASKGAAKGPVQRTGSGAQQASSGKVPSKLTYDAGGAMVRDAVPVHLRGQQHVAVPVHVTPAMLRKKILLSGKA